MEIDTKLSTSEKLIEGLRKEANRNAKLQGDKSQNTSRRRRTFWYRNHLFTNAANKIKELEAQLDKVRGQVIELRTREFVLEKHLVEATDECPKCYAGIIISNGFLVCPECDWTEEKQAALSTGGR